MHRSDKLPELTLSPPPYRKFKSRYNATPNRESSSGNLSSPTLARAKARIPIWESNLVNMRSLATNSVPLVDPITKRPIIPPAGRSIPKLRMADLTASLAPLLESQMSKPENSPLTVSSKRIAEALKEVTGSKDMLETFDDAIKLPDIRSINSRVAQLRKGIGPTLTHLPKTSSLGLTSLSLPRNRGAPLEPKRQSARVSPKNEEENIRKLMGQLKEKYLIDMEKELGLAIQRRLPAVPQSKSSVPDQSGDNSAWEVVVPRPSTDATEIASRIDKVVRELAKESQKLSTGQNTVIQTNAQQLRNGKGTLTSSARSGAPRASNDLSNTSVDSEKQSANKNSLPLNNTLQKNKNLAKISTAFRKMLDPISKQDVNELIEIPADEHVKKLEQEHEERRRAHASVFKNVVVSKAAVNSEGKEVPHLSKKGKKKINKATERRLTETETIIQQKNV